MTNAEILGRRWGSGFVISHSFVIRHSSFVIWPYPRLANAPQPNLIHPCPGQPEGHIQLTRNHTSLYLVPA